MLIIAGVWSIYHFHFIGTSVARLMDTNYREINAANNMIQALEREDSAVLLLLLGNWDQGRPLLQSADSSFAGAFQAVAKASADEKEAELVEQVRRKYDRYKELWLRPIVGTEKENNLDWYFETVHQAFLETKSAVNQLALFHEEVLYKTSLELRNQANRATMPGIVAIIAALVFTLLFSYLVNYFMINPIIRVINGISQFLQTGELKDLKIRTRDEIGELASAVQYLCSNVDRSKITS
jgi:methyl-accepting chemotaxis protein